MNYTWPYIRREKIQHALDHHGEVVRKQEEKFWRLKIDEIEENRQREFQIERETLRAEIRSLERRIDSLSVFVKKAEQKRLDAVKMIKRSRVVASSIAAQVKDIVEQDARSLHEFLVIEDMAIQNEVMFLKENSYDETR
jgi:hypothetical protein